MTQRRRYERFDADIPCRLYIPAEKKGDPPRFEAFLRVKDLSFGGVFIKSGFQLKDDAQLMVELHLPDEALPVAGRVVRKVDGGMGIAFEELSKKAREALLRHFVPDEHRAFHATLGDVMPGMPVDRVSLILHLWDDWRHAADSRPPGAPPPRPPLPSPPPPPASRPALPPPAPAAKPTVRGKAPPAKPTKKGR